MAFITLEQFVNAYSQTSPNAVIYRRWRKACSCPSESLDVGKTRISHLHGSEAFCQRVIKQWTVGGWVSLDSSRPRGSHILENLNRQGEAPDKSPEIAPWGDIWKSQSHGGVVGHGGRKKGVFNSASVWLVMIGGDQASWCHVLGVCLIMGTPPIPSRSRIQGHTSPDPSQYLTTYNARHAPLPQPPPPPHYPTERTAPPLSTVPPPPPP